MIEIHVGAILLAAGGSTRMGRPKQLLEIDGEPLLHRIAREVLEGGASPVVVVLGCEAEKCAESLGGLAAITVVNDGWASGQASSLRLGLETLRTCRQPCDAAIVTLCDQVNLRASIIAAFIATYRDTGKGIVASQYSEALGAPALFSARYFPQIASLHGDHGARAIIRLAGQDLAVLPFPEGAIDLDTPSDHESWLQTRQATP